MASTDNLESQYIRFEWTVRNLGELFDSRCGTNAVASLTSSELSIRAVREKGNPRLRSLRSSEEENGRLVQSSCMTMLVTARSRIYRSYSMPILARQAMKVMDMQAYTCHARYEPVPSTYLFVLTRTICQAYARRKGELSQWT